MIRISKISVVAILLLLSAASCVDPYAYPFEEVSDNMVVEAALTTLPGPQQVRLSATRNIYNRDNRSVLYIKGARVSVIDSDGLEHEYLEKGNGYYFSDAAFSAVVGKSYRLKIVTAEGVEYQSDSELAAGTTEMTDIEARYQRKSERNARGVYESVDGFSIAARVNDAPDQRNYYLLRMKITYKVLTHPESYQVFDTGLGRYVPAPKPCCNICWITEQLPEFVVYGDQTISGQKNAEVPLGYFEARSKYFFEKVYFEVTQYTLSSGGYAFWKSLADLKFKQGTLFDPSPAELPGNIHNTADPEEQVIGYFTVSGVSTAGSFISNHQIPGGVRYDFVFNDDCRLLANSTADRPLFWR